MPDYCSAVWNIMLYWTALQQPTNHIVQTAFSNALSLEWKLLCLDLSFSEICSHRCYWQLDSIGSFNGLAPNRQQSIIGGNVHPRPTMLYRINRLGWVNSSSPRQNGSHLHLADNIFRCIFVNKKFCILIKISLKFVPKGPIDNRSALV